MTETTPRKSDLSVRVVSAVVMVGVAGTALWLGGNAWALFVAAIALGVMWEWHALVRAFARSIVAKIAWLGLGVLYIGLAAITLVLMGLSPQLKFSVLLLLLAVIATDVGAYFAGRAIGGPKIAPAISPSKTWSGLLGGAISAGLALAAGVIAQRGLDGAGPIVTPLAAFGLGVLTAIISQMGDFFESWMKRRAGVKDSGSLIPGHGGLLDRVDGLVAVLFCSGVFFVGTLIAYVYFPDPRWQ